ncbi:RsfA family transcriptional regulator [Jeotgalibacillus salarius]|uniref:RsfA family transcriptional regulator n=1 Tax=Jeotgalibacillus salarius TaxID=546023 RepID=A0A4Y8LC55_9BACL|nr:RsfA family transcriptional regulator [Jeotgalibacillus salarius]
MRVKLRQDGWTSHEDQLLKERVLAHIERGSTQLNAFEEIAIELNRTPAACGFRWNSCLRKECQKQISEAKKVRYAKRREEEKKSVEKSSDWNAEQLIMRMNQWISRLEQSKPAEEMELRVIEAEKDREKLEKDNQLLKEQISELKEDYHALLYLIEKARKLGTEDGDRSSSVFKMEPNGNLFRMEKKAVNESSEHF